MNVHFGHIPERKGHGGRLGRHIEHDERSRAFAAPEASGPLKSVTWERHVPIFDQGDLGSCTGNAMTGAKATGPLFSANVALSESTAVALYSRATHLDKVPGAFPPDDTGSSGIAVAKAAKELGWISAYHHAFTLTAALAAVARGPVIIGVNWYSDFDQPQGDKAELVYRGGEIRGGHELLVRGIDVENGHILLDNSWSSSWGNQGSCVMSFGTFKFLLKTNGDVVVPVL